MFYSDNTNYMGRWVNDKRSGYGVLRNNLEGWRFLSLWKEDKKHGRGIFIRFVFKSWFLAITEDLTGRNGWYWNCSNSDLELELFSVPLPASGGAWNCFSYCTTVPLHQTVPQYLASGPFHRTTGPFFEILRFYATSDSSKTVPTVPELVRSSMLATLVTNRTWFHF